MKLLLFFAENFSYRPFKKVLDQAPHQDEEGRSFNDSVVVFFQFEEEDQTKGPELIRKVIKNIKWICGKFGTKQVVFHSFNHLSSSKAPPEFAPPKIKEIRDRLERSGYLTSETPYGYLNEWSIHVRGESLAKVFKEL